MIKKYKIILMIFTSLLVPEISSQSNKPVIGIGEMTSSVGGDVKSFQSMLETAIASTNKFDLIERSRIGGVKKVNEFKDGFLILISILKLLIFKK